MRNTLTGVLGRDSDGVVLQVVADRNGRCTVRNAFAATHNHSSKEINLERAGAFRGMEDVSRGVHTSIASDNS